MSGFFRFAVWVTLALAATSASANGMLDSVTNAFEAGSTAWMGNALGYAKTLFFGLAALEFAWSAIQLTLKKSELSEIAVSTMFKVMSIAFFAMVLTQAPTWIPLIMDSFKQAGAGVSGGGQALSPSAIIDHGIDIAAEMINKGMEVNSQQNGGLVNAVSSGGASLGEYLLSAIVIGLSGLLVMLSFSVVAVQLVVALVESYLVIGGGALMLGFLGSRWTLNYGEKYFGYAVSVGVKLFTLYLIVGFGDTLAQAMMAKIQAVGASENGVQFGDWISLAGSSLTFAGVGYMVPGLASSMMNGSPSLSMSGLGAAAGTVAAAPIAGAMAGGAAGLQAGGMVTGAAAALLRGRSAVGGIGGLLNRRSGPVGGIGGAPGGGSGGFPGSGGQPGKPGNQTPGSSLPLSGKQNNGMGGDKGGKADGDKTKALAGGSSGELSKDGFAGKQVRDEYIGNQSRDNRPGEVARTEERAPPRFDQGDKQPKGKLAGAADWMKQKASETQYQADRRKPHLVHDGGGGGVPSMRLSLD